MDAVIDTAPCAVLTFQEIVAEEFLMKKRMMQASRSALGLLKTLEGYRERPYADRGHTSVGYGTFLHAGAPTRADSLVRWTKKRAECAMMRMIEIVEHRINREVRVSLTQNQFDAITLWAYNCGPYAIDESKQWLQELNNGNHELVPALLARWNKSFDPDTGETREDPGLINRRKIETELFKKR
jgi:GH24 family phage-related lysozyme (muramidase)